MTTALKPAITVLLLTLSMMTMAQNENSIAEAIAAYPYPVKYCELNDSTNVAYLDEGKGANTLIFIHGLATYIPSWMPLFEKQKDSNRCIAIDLPGYGRSSKAEFEASMDYYAEVLLSMIKKLKLKNVMLVGHSMGSQIAVTTVLKKPELFKQLILLAPAGFETFTPDQATWLKTVTTPQIIAAATDDQIRANWKLNFYDMPTSVEFMIEDRIKMKACDDFELYCRSVAMGVTGMLDGPIFDDLDKLSTKTLVVYGENDMLIPNRYLNPTLTIKSVAEAGVAKIPNASLKFIPNCGHFITYDQPAMANELISEFLAQ